MNFLITTNVNVFILPFAMVMVYEYDTFRFYFLTAIKTFP